jgi:Domain of unknown function (DU1801)
MANAKNKTSLTEASVEEFLKSLADEQQRIDSRKIIEIMQRVTGEPPKMWGPSIVGFGMRHLKYDSGREMDWMLTGFSPRKGNLTLYVLNGSAKQEELLAKLGKFKTGKGCLYIKRLSDVDENVVEEVVVSSLKDPGC